MLFSLARVQVGVGLSRTDRADGFVHDEDQVGRDLYSFISQFFTVFPHGGNPLFLVRVFVSVSSSPVN